MLYDFAVAAARGTFRRPGFSLVVVTVVALSLGLAIAAASLAYEVFVRPLPYPDAGRLHILSSTNRTDGWWESPGSVAEFRHYQRAATRDADLAIFFDQQSLTLSSDNATEQAERIPATFAEHNYFTLLGAVPAQGRNFTAEETAQGGAHPVAVVSHDFWQARLGGRPDVLGHTLRLNGRPHTVIGVMPAGFRDVSNEIGPPAVWLPFPLAVHHLGPELYSHYNLRRCRALVRLAPDSSLVVAQQEADTIALAIEKERPGDSHGRGFLLQPVRHYFFWRVNQAVAALFAGALLVVGLAAVNLANLFLVDGLRRVRELSVRAALGADGRQLVQIVLAGVLGPVGLGGLAGFGVGAVLLGALRRAGVLVLPEFVRLEYSPVALGAGLLLLFGVAVAAALMPAWRARRLDLRSAMQSGSKGGSDAAGTRSRNGLVAAEVALAAALLVGAGLTAKSLLEMTRRPLGYNPESLLTMQIQMDRGRLPEREQRARFAQQVQAAIQDGPGFRAATIFGPSMLGTSGWVVGLLPGHLDPADRRAMTNLQLLNTAPGGLEKLGIRLLRGRDFSPAALYDQPAEVILDERAARRFWPGEDPLGKTLFIIQTVVRPAVVIGLAAPARHRGRAYDENTGNGDTYFSYQQFPMDQINVMVRLDEGMESAALAFVRQQIARLDPTLAVYDVATMTTRLAREERAPRFTATVFMVYAAISLLLTVVGVYGVLAFSIAQRTREFGIRFAVGASRSQVIRLVVGQSSLWIGAGLGAGLVLAAVAAPALGDLLIGLNPRDSGVFGASAAIIAAAGLLATLVPAWRAARVNPVEVLRAE